MTFKPIISLLFFPALLAAQTSAFNTSNENWRASGDPQSTIPVWQPTGGNPGGFIQVTDAAIGGTWYFDASNLYKGNKCDAYDKFLRWDQFASDTSQQQPFGGSPDVVLEGGGYTLVFDNPQNPGLSWTHYDIRLREDAGWRLGNNTGPAPTAQEFQAALANISALRIRGEYRAQADYGGLDNFVLESSFQFDLDGDDSSGETTGGFIADTTCTALARVADADAVLVSEDRVDSIVLRVVFAQNPLLETLTAGPLPAGIALQQHAPGWIALVNTGAATTADFLTALLSVRYSDLSVNPPGGLRTVSVRAYTGCGERANRYAYLPVSAPGNAGLDADTVLCGGGAPVDLLQVLGGTPQAGGFWKPAPASGANLLDPDLDAPGVYTYLIPGAGQCPGDTARVTVQIEPAFQLRHDTTMCYGDTLRLNVPTGLSAWRWGDSSRESTLDVSGPGLYWLDGQTDHCTFSDSARIDFITCEDCPLYAPNAFSPNDDGQNDTWQVFLSCAWQRFRLEVFDRWGNQVFVSSDPEQGWDGRWRGKEAPAGVYVWRLEWEGELFGELKKFRKSGDLTIVR